KQDAINANTPVGIAGGDVRGDSSSATQTANNNANADASNHSKTSQEADPEQIAGSSKCWSGCGGNGQEQNVAQVGLTKQHGNSDSKAKQKALNTDVPFVRPFGQKEE